MLHEIHPLNEEEIRLIEDGALGSILAQSIKKQGQITSPAAPFAAPAESYPAVDRKPYSKALSCRDCVFFDIETTGLSADTAFLFLIGYICYEENSWNRHQLCIHLVQEEKALLSSFFEAIKKAQCLIHFNGNTFDIPFVQKRAAANGLFPPFDRLISIDLYQRFRALRKILNLPKMNQSFLEKYSGWEREDHLSGKEVVSVFWRYAASNTFPTNEASLSAGNSEYSRRKICPDTDAPASFGTEQLLLRHNRDDLLGMVQILRFESYHMLFAGHIRIDKTETIQVSDPDTCEYECMQLSFSTIQPLPHSLILTKPIHESHAASKITLFADGQTGKLTIPVFSGTLRYYLHDYKNYYYLPLEHQVIHKSIASYVAKEYRIPAKPDTCFIERSGCFLPLPNVPSSSDAIAFLKERPLFQENYENKDFYIEYTNELEEQEEMITSYARILLTYIAQR